MKFRSTILSVADVSQIRQLPPEYASMLLLDVHEGRIRKGDLARFNGMTRTVLDVATNTDFFDQYVEGSIGIAIGGEPIDGDDNMGRSLIVAEEG